MEFKGPTRRNNQYFVVEKPLDWRDGDRPRLQSDSYRNQAILYGAVKMHKNYIMGTRCVYNWTNTMVDMGFDKLGIMIGSLTMPGYSMPLLRIGSHKS